jgi:hypothetical protein
MFNFFKPIELFEEKPKWKYSPISINKFFIERISQLNRYEPTIKKSNDTKYDIAKMKKNNKNGLYVKLEDVISLMNNLE